MPSPREPLGLAELLTALRIEIDKAIVNQERSGKDAIFQLKEAEVEIHFVVSTEGKDGVSVGIPKLFAVEMGDSTKAENLHKLKVTLSPKPGKEVDLAGSSAGD